MGGRNIEFPNKKYDIIYADPPWDCNARRNLSKKELSELYDVMTFNEIALLPVNQISKKDSFLYIWIIDSMILEGIYVCKKWGFEPKRSFIWDKKSIGLGYYNRAQHEQLLICKKGTPIMPDKSNLSSSIISCSRGSHSVKPLQFKTIIEKQHPTLPFKIELFARRIGLFADMDDGWDYWGNDV